MTEVEKKRAEEKADKDAKELALLLLLALRRRSGTAFVTWDPHNGRFIYRGRTVATTTIRKFLLRIQDRLATRIITLTNRLESGAITVDEWQAEFEDTISSAHILSAAFALGGIALASNNPFVQRQITEQWAFARDFTKDIKRKRDPLSFARIKARAKSYVQAAHITYANVELGMVKLTGVMTQARNVLTLAEHCEGRKEDVIGCIDVTNRGWVDIEEIVPIGQRLCERHCKCFLEYR
jgi:hypothetical protein